MSVLVVSAPAALPSSAEWRQSSVAFIFAFSVKPPYRNGVMTKSQARLTRKRVCGSSGLRAIPTVLHTASLLWLRLRASRWQPRISISAHLATESSNWPAGTPSTMASVEKNTLTSDYLYLRNPHAGGFYGFRFNADFFACAGDGRWWRDHRFPGGIAFTANSTGHMMRYRDWYQEQEQNESWALKQAMLTIQNAAPTKSTDSSDAVEQGRATWLRPLDASGKPLAEDSPCPVERMPTMLGGKDWTRYEGVLHTDHSVREEFFFDREIAPTASKPYLMDFTYLYDETGDDFEEFSRGKRFDDSAVFAEIGRPEDWDTSHR